jgi:hypothetical protein
MAIKLASIVSFIAFTGFFLFSPILQAFMFHRCIPNERWDFAVPGDGGYTVSHYMRDCAFIGSAPEEGIFAERARFLWPETKTLFEYEPTDYPGTVYVIPTGPNTVTVSVKELVQVFLAETRWGTLKVDYNIGSIRNPRSTDPVTTGDTWAEREQVLLQGARGSRISP